MRYEKRNIDLDSYKNMYSGGIRGGKISCNSGITGKSQDGEKVSRGKLRSCSIYGPCARSAESRLGIDVEHDFEPKYITIRGKGELLASLRKAAKKQIKFISQLTLTARERQFPGICRLR